MALTLHLCLALVLAFSVTLVNGQKVLIETPQWATLSIARPYDPITFSVNLTNVPVTLTTLEVIPGPDVHSNWVRRCALVRTSPSSNEFKTATGCVVPALVGHHVLFWGTNKNKYATATFEVSCSNGIACDGTERLVWSASGRARCAATRPICNDYNSCTQDQCSTTGICNFVARPDARECQTCKGNGCRPNCGSGNRRFKCGFDGCFGHCGPTCGRNELCASGECVRDARIGTCMNPITLNEEARRKEFSGKIVRTVDISKGLDVLVPKCRVDAFEPGRPVAVPRDPEMIFQLDLPASAGYVGLGVRTRSSAGSLTIVTIIEAELNKTNLDACLDSNVRPATVWACDASNDLDGSDVSTWMMRPGRTYFIAVEKEGGFARPTNITVSFNLSPECTMFCPSGAECGDSGCEGLTCGDCNEGERCLSNRCIPCTPSCANVPCGGSDGCGGQCLCRESNMLAEPFSTLVMPALRGESECNHILPRCTYVLGGVVREGCPRNLWCSNECKCLSVGAKLPDLSLMPFRAYVDEMFVANNESCAYEEGCLGGLGNRLIIKFDTKVFNQGPVPFRLPSPPSSRPDLFEWAPCHGHWHTKDFLRYELLDQKRNIITLGQKRSFCLMDMTQVQNRPDAPCTATYTCDRQGLAVGWTDVYDDTLDCQWIDVTGIKPGTYIVRQCVNPLGKFSELSFENNCIESPVVVPVTASPTTAAPTAPTPPAPGPCAPGCPPYWLADGFCDPVCNNAACSFDKGDCQVTNCAPGCPTAWLADGACDANCNNAECGFDRGDCSPTTQPTPFPVGDAPTRRPRA